MVSLCNNILQPKVVGSEKGTSEKDGLLGFVDLLYAEHPYRLFDIGEIEQHTHTESWKYLAESKW